MKTIPEINQAFNICREYAPPTPRTATPPTKNSKFSMRNSSDDSLSKFSKNFRILVRWLGSSAAAGGEAS